MKPGDRVGPYEIVEPLGAGGMGEVYRALDSRLGRHVAVKVLPADMARDAEALARFERETRAVAALSHPNILEIYDVGVIDGTAYAVTELLEGETLAELLVEGPLPVRNAVQYGKQLALGLAAAHDKGVVHRDVKPANVFVTRDGRVKLLDFGLARGSALLGAKAGDSLQETVAGTQPGAVLGTVGYMSPEQVRGETADARSDIFALGAVLHEMLTGKAPFRRDTNAETLTAILREDPPEDLPERPMPASLRRVVRRCLEKRVEDRFQGARDLAFAIENASLTSSSDIAEAGAAIQPAETTGRSGPGWPVAIGLAAVAGVAAVLLAGALRPAADHEPPRMRQITFSGQDFSPSASPDGRLVAFASARDGRPRIWLKELLGGGEQPLTEGPDVDPRFHPEGGSILFTRLAGDAGDLYRIALVGGQARKLAEHVVEGEWAPDGSRVALLRAGDAAGYASNILSILDVETGEERELFRVQNQLLIGPRFAPDGDTIAITSVPSIGGAGGYAIHLVDATTGESRLLPSRGPDGNLSKVAWLPDGGSLLFGVSDSSTGDRTGLPGRIVIQPIDGTERTTVMWVNGLFPQRGSAFEYGGISLLGDGALVIDTLHSSQTLHEFGLRDDSTALDGVASGTQLTWGVAQDRQPAYAPDGTRMIFSSNRSGNLDLWTVDLQTRELTQLTDDPAQDWDPAFTPDGSSILWSSDRGGNLEIWGADADGNNARQISHNGVDAQNPTLAPDGSWIVYASANPERPGIYRMRPDGEEESILLEGPLAIPEVSPDSRYVVYSTSIVGRTLVKVLELNSGEVLPFEITMPNAVLAPTVTYGRARWIGPNRIAYVGHAGETLSGILAQDFRPGVDTSDSRQRIAGFFPAWTTESFDVSTEGDRITLSLDRPRRTLRVVDRIAALSSKSPR